MWIHTSNFVCGLRGGVKPVWVGKHPRNVKLCQDLSRTVHLYNNDSFFVRAWFSKVLFSTFFKNWWVKLRASVLKLYDAVVYSHQYLEAMHQSLSTGLMTLDIAVRKLLVFKKVDFPGESNGITRWVPLLLFSLTFSVKGIVTVNFADVKKTMKQLIKRAARPTSDTAQPCALWTQEDTTLFIAAVATDSQLPFKNNWGRVRRVNWG